MCTSSLVRVSTGTGFQTFKVHTPANHLRKPLSKRFFQNSKNSIIQDACKTVCVHGISTMPLSEGARVSFLGKALAPTKKRELALSKPDIDVDALVIEGKCVSRPPGPSRSWLVDTRQVAGIVTISTRALTLLDDGGTRTTRGQPRVNYAEDGAESEPEEGDLQPLVVACAQLPCALCTV